MFQFIFILPLVLSKSRFARDTSICCNEPRQELIYRSDGPEWKCEKASFIGYKCSETINASCRRDTILYENKLRFGLNVLLNDGTTWDYWIDNNATYSIETELKCLDGKWKVFYTPDEEFYEVKKVICDQMKIDEKEYLASIQ